MPDGFVEDRATMFDGGLDVGRMLRELPAKRDQLRAKLDLLERQLSDGRRFVLGAHPSLADFSLHHSIFALQSLPATAALLEPFARVRAWAARIAGFGHGTHPLFVSNMGLRSDQLDAARRRLHAYFDRLEAEIGPSGYLVGDRFGVADLSAAAVMTAIIRPPEFPYPLPEP